MSSAQWETQPNLGSFIENYNFNLHPLVIGFASDVGSTVIKLNGNLPAGLQYTRISNTIVISGESTGVVSSTISYITFRVTDPDGTIDDRTYNITITPIAIAPTWNEQNPFLGYMTVNTTATFIVTATISNDSIITYSLEPAPTVLQVPTGMSINEFTGVITYTNTIPLPVPIDFSETYNVTVVATAGEESESIVISITVLGHDHVPGWITEAGSLGTYVIDDWVEIIFETYEPNNDVVTYTLNNLPVNFPFILTPTGFLYGETPLTTTETLWSFGVDATSNVGVASQTFNILVIAGPSEQLMWNNPMGELGTWLDGQYVIIPVSAVSNRSPRISYEFIGGSLPPDLKLNSSQGYIAGFLEFHPQSRDYYFEIQATDYIQKIILQYHIGIQRNRLDKYINVTLPIQGELKQALINTRGEMIPSGVMIPNSNVHPFIPIDNMNLISGLSFEFDKASHIIQQISSQAHSLNLLLNNTSNVNIGNSTIFYRNVIDFQANASPITTRLVGNIIAGSTAISYNPISLNNIRTALISDVGFVNDGLGSGASFSTIIDQYSTSIVNVTVIDSGTGYFDSPNLIVIGTGNDAIVTANLSVQSTTIINNGSGWSEGEVFNVIIDSDHILVLEASNVDVNGSLQEITIIDGSNFTIFPHGNRYISNGNAAIAEVGFDLGISSVNIVSGGSGYSPLIMQNVMVSGSEILPDWQSTWQPTLYVGTVYSTFDNAVISTITASMESMLTNIVWPVQWITLTAKGRSWTGNTSFDNDICSFDGEMTRFIEWQEPKDTIFDNDGNTIFDMKETVFDNNYGLGIFACDIWQNIVWDPDISIFDVYASLASDIDSEVISTTEITRIYRLTSQQVGNYNKSF